MKYTQREQEKWVSNAPLIPLLEDFVCCLSSARKKLLSELFMSETHPTEPESQAWGKRRRKAGENLPLPESRRGCVPMQMLRLSSSSSGGRLKSSQAHLALTPLRLEPSVSMPLSTLSCLERTKEPEFLQRTGGPRSTPPLRCLLSPCRC